MAADGPRIGLVLGAGGAAGAAFHAGTLLALQHDIGWNPNSADVIVGSSAGSIVGGLLRAGLSPDDLCAWGTSVAALPTGRSSRALLDDIRSTRHRVAPSLPTPSVPSLSMLARVLRPSHLRLHTAALALLPGGWLDAPKSLERIGELLVDWPSRALWITAVRTGDARRVVFGRDDVEATPGQAIAASCAIPGAFKPVQIGRHRYIDGGAHSPTNADVLRSADIDAAIVLSPMSAQPGSMRRRPDHALRALFHRRLRSECDQLRRAGIDVHVFEPDRATLDVMGINALDNTRSPRVVRDAFLAAGEKLSRDGSLRSLLSPDAAAVSADSG